MYSHISAPKEIKNRRDILTSRVTLKSYFTR